MLKFHVYGQRLRMENAVVAADSMRYLTAQFLFQTEDWQGAEKTAVFSQGGESYSIPLTEDCIRAEDHLDLTDGEWTVHVVGDVRDGAEIVQRITTTQVRFMVEPSGAVSGEPFPEIAPSYGEQVLAAALSAKETAQSVRDDADNGLFNGLSGIVVSETEPTDEHHPVWIDPTGEVDNPVMSVNGKQPDETGNVEVETGEISSEEIAAAVEEYLTENPVDAPVQSVNGKTGAVELTASDVGAMAAYDPVGMGSFSMGRKTNTTVGSYSHTEGSNNTASGNYSHAEGYNTTASGSYSHAEGICTMATRLNQHAEGSYSIPEDGGATTRGQYLHIAGNGTSTTARSNAHTLDWDGNAWFAGDVYVGSTSGTNRDDGSKKLATEEKVAEMIAADDTSLGITGATVGQTIKITEVDDEGRPTGWEAVDAASGGEENWQRVEYEIQEGTSAINLNLPTANIRKARLYLSLYGSTGKPSLRLYGDVEASSAHGDKIIAGFENFYTTAASQRSATVTIERWGDFWRVLYTDASATATQLRFPNAAEKFLHLVCLSDVTITGKAILHYTE